LLIAREVAETESEREAQANKFL